MKKIFSVIGNIIFYSFTAAVIAVLVLLLCGIRPYITMSGSMEPNIEVGSVCFVNTKADYSEMKEGDIIAFKNSLGGLVTHRIVSITEAGLETKGDANEHSDGISTTEANFHGQTLFSVPKAGYLLKALQQPQNIAISVVLLCTIAALGAVDRSDEKKKEEKTTQNN